MSNSPGATPDLNWILKEQIAKLVRRTASELAKSPGFCRSDQPDIEQELRLHLVRKAALFNAARAKETTFAQRLIKRKAVSMARHVAAKKRSCFRMARSLDDVVANGDRGRVEAAQLVESSAGRRHTGQQTRSEAELAQLRLDVADANRDLPASLRILAALLCHVPQFAAGEVLSMSRRQTAVRVAALRARYEARGLGV